MTALWLALGALNLASYASFGIDKRRAREGAARLSQRSLLALAALGGTAGAYLGRWHFRHKTRKARFSAALHLIAAGQFGLLAWLVMRP